MRIQRRIILVLLGLCMAGMASAEADKESLLEAWDGHVRSLPGTIALEETDEGTYRLQDTDLPYEGTLRLVSALVRSADNAGFDTGFSHMGIVEFTLDDLPSERLASQSYYYWLADRQTLHYSTAEQRWVGGDEYQATLTNLYGGESTSTGLSFMLNYGIWILLAGLIVLAAIAVARQSRKASSLMDQSRGINQRASDNLDRAQTMQDEVLAIAREARDLQRENNDLLAQIRDALPALETILIADADEDLGDDVLSLPKLMAAASPLARFEFAPQNQLKDAELQGPIRSRGW